MPRGFGLCSFHQYLPCLPPSPLFFLLQYNSSFKISFNWSIHIDNKQPGESFFFIEPDATYHPKRYQGRQAGRITEPTRETQLQQAAYSQSLCLSTNLKVPFPFQRNQSGLGSSVGRSNYEHWAREASVSLWASESSLPPDILGCQEAPARRVHQNKKPSQGSLFGPKPLDKPSRPLQHHKGYEN